MKRLVLLIPLSIFLALPLLAATTVQPVIEVSSQQAIIRYRTTLAPSTACSHALTETISGATPDDANPSIFSGSNLDTRPGSILNAPDRAFVFGQRTAAPGLDGLLHSRSAKANTAYTDVVTCGTDAPVTISFNTGNIQNGGTYTEQPPFSTAGFGNWAWPTINWSNQSAQYTDPQTGVVIERATAPGWWGKETGFANFDFAIGGTGYTNPQNILNGAACAGSSSTCAESTNSNSIFVSMKGQNYSASSPQYSSGYDSSQSYDDILLALIGKASASGAETVTVCLSFYDSGATCDSGTQTITLGTSVSTVGFPANGIGYTGSTNQWNPVFQFGEWGGTAPKQGDFGNAFGTAAASTGVTTSGTAVTGDCAAHNSSPACFNVRWNNAYFYIQGSGCTDGGTDICQISGHPADPEHLTLKNAPATACASQCNWNSLNAGFLIKPNGAGTVDIGAQYSSAYSAMYGLYLDGIQQVCNPAPVSVGYQANGTTPISPPVPGNLCMVPFQDGGSDIEANGQLFLLIPSTGETRLLSPLFCRNACDTTDASGDQIAAQIKYPVAPWDGVSGLCFYGTGVSASGPLSIYKGCYNTADNWKAYSHPLYACGNCASNPSGVSPGQDPTTIWYSYARWSDDPITYTNITPPSMGLGILAQIEAKNTTYQSTIWSSIVPSNVANGAFLFILNAGSQGTSASIAAFSTSTGLITTWGDTFFNYPTRFCGLHDLSITRVTPGYLGTSCNYLAYNSSSISLGGPFQATPYYVYFSGTPSTNTALTATSPLEPCSNYTIASNIMSLITQNGGENQCMHIRMKNVTSHTPSAAELALWPSGQNALWSEPTVLQAGDTIALPQEQALVAAVTTGVTDAQCSADCLDVVVARGIPTFSNGRPPAIEANGWIACAGPTLASAAGCGGTPGVGSWIPLNTAGPMAGTGIFDPQAFGSHVATGAGLSSGNMTFVSAAYEVRFNKTLPAQAGSFAGANQIAFYVPFFGTTGNITLQSYPSNEQYAAPSSQEKRWFLDYNHTNPSFGAGGEQSILIDPIAYSLVSGTSTVYKVTSPAGNLTPNEANYKTNGLEGWAGHNLLQDASGPSSSLSDAVAYQTCIALAAGECRSGSSTNDVFVTVPNVPSIQSNCVSDWLVESYPCVAMSLPNLAGSLSQRDGSYSYSAFEGARRLTMGLTGWGRQYEFSTFIPDSTGTWGFFKADWADGVRSEIFMARLPPFPGSSSVPRSTYVNLPVSVPAGAAYAEIRFGYMENGSAQSYYCTSRQDTCTTSGSPFAYPSIDSRTLVSCSSGCTIHIPAIAGRAVYYSIGSSANGSTWTYGAPQVGLVQ